MSYATKQNLIDRFGQPELIELTDRATPPTGAIDDTVIAKALDDADSAINGYLAVRYTLPLSPVPTILTRLAADIARYFLYEDKATDAVKERYDAAIAYLKDVAAGKANLGVDAASKAPAVAGGPAVDAGDRVFTVGRPSKGIEGTLDDY